MRDGRSSGCSRRSRRASASEDASGAITSIADCTLAENSFSISYAALMAGVVIGLVAVVAIVGILAWGLAKPIVERLKRRSR